MAGTTTTDTGEERKKKHRTKEEEEAVPKKKKRGRRNNVRKWRMNSDSYGHFLCEKVNDILVISPMLLVPQQKCWVPQATIPFILQA